MTRAVPKICLDFLLQAEALKTKAYQDSKGVWTIGVGHTGPEVVRGLTWARAQCLAALAHDADAHADLLAKRVKADILERLSDHQYSALVSFVFNLGANPTWTIWKVLNRGALNAVPAEMKRFDKVKHEDGTVETIPGLTNRRGAEVIFWNTPDMNRPDDAMAVAGTVATPPSSMTRAADTPPTPTDTKPLSQSKSFMTAAATTIAAASGAVGEISKTVSPFAAQSPFISHMISTLAMIAAGWAVATLVFVWLKRRQT